MDATTYLEYFSCMASRRVKLSQRETICPQVSPDADKRTSGVT